MNEKQKNCGDLLFVDGDHRECGHYFKPVSDAECSRCGRPLKINKKPVPYLFVVEVEDDIYLDQAWPKANPGVNIIRKRGKHV